MTKQFAVFGNPIQHSLSPRIHQQFATQHGLNIDYRKIQSQETEFVESVNQFFHSGGEGCNVTVPFKEQAFDLCNQLSDSAKRARAVNTLYKNNAGEFAGHNTDGAGLLRDLTNNLELSLKNQSIIILGAGGATRGILQPLISQEPASIHIINRTLARAETLAEEFSDLFSIESIAADSIPVNLPAADLIINATSASLNAALPITDSSVITATTVAYDLAYSMEPTRFLHWVKECGGNRIHDGRGMLVEQAALAFTTWTTLDVDTSYLINNFETLTQ